MKSAPEECLGPILFCIYTTELMHLFVNHGVQFTLSADGGEVTIEPVIFCPSFFFYQKRKSELINLK